MPGLIDVHTYGAVGTDTMDDDFDFYKWQNFLFEYGVTTFFPSTVSADREHILRVLKKLANITEVESINLEGPYISIQKKGAHDENAICPGAIEEFDEYYKTSGGKITTCARN